MWCSLPRLLNMPEGLQEGLPTGAESWLNHQMKKRRKGRSPSQQKLVLQKILLWSHRLMLTIVVNDLSSFLGHLAPATGLDGHVALFLVQSNHRQGSLNSTESFYCVSRAFLFNGYCEGNRKYFRICTSTSKEVCLHFTQTVLVFWRFTQVKMAVEFERWIFAW